MQDSLFVDVSSVVIALRTVLAHHGDGENAARLHTHWTGAPGHWTRAPQVHPAGLRLLLGAPARSIEKYKTLFDMYSV